MLRHSDLPAIWKEIGEGDKTAAQGNQAQAMELLKSYLEGQTSQRNMGSLKDLLSSGALPEGSGASIGGSGTVSATKGYNPTSVTNAGASQAKHFVDMANKEYKPISDQLDASKATLDALDQKNATSDKIAIVNEARLVAGQGGSRALKTVMDQLSGGKTANMKFQDTLNYFNNTPEIPTMTDGQRDSIRESVFNRTGQLANLHSQTKAKLAQQGPAVAPLADSNSLLSSVASPVDQKLGEIKSMQQEYSKQKANMPGNPVSSPSTADANPSNLQRLMSFFKPQAKAQAAPQQAAQAPQAPALDDVDAAVAKAMQKKQQAALLMQQKQKQQAQQAPQAPQAPQGQ